MMKFLVDFSNVNLVFDQALEIRRKVFCEEQNYPLEEEIDEYDELSFHVVGFYNDKPVSCARIVKKDDEWYLGRIAVLKEFRGKGLGLELVNYLVDFTTNKLKAEEIYLNAQETAIALYEKVGFKIISKPFYEGKIKHFKMVR
ncbi:GNAT family N-acetyltransferase [Spiroplasma floricola]|uniref:Acetyltransferase, GNAT family protein n=1 Tax=Spiroplasma floricola 23-6 TaxID=1336749 RepID=A0A2K8SEG4_9MOLU|nr:GNAT family N-acetyltransferase [Spiroplasma floricola]AUB31230.1 acetyltransferase, GNAT family protein [Spiroplasma floricola 23-6]